MVSWQIQGMDVATKPLHWDHTIAPKIFYGLVSPFDSNCHKTLIQMLKLLKFTNTMTAVAIKKEMNALG